MNEKVSVLEKEIEESRRLTKDVESGASELEA